MAVDTAPWQNLTGVEWLKALACPRCGHEMQITYQSEVIVMGRMREEFERLYLDAPDFAERFAEAIDEPKGHSGLGGSRAHATIPARCNCRDKHEGQPPADDAGCGQWGAIKAP
jgi:hypothetical protein